MAGNIIGKPNTPTSSVASGVWNLREQLHTQKNNIWPKLGIITSGLIFHLDAATYPGSGTTWTDLTGNNNGVLQNSPTYNTANGGYFTFNGTSQEVTTSIQYSNLNSSSFTFFGWIRTNSASGKKIIGFENTQTGTGTTSYDKHVYINTSGKLVFGIYTGSGTIITGTKTVSDNVWHSFAAVYNDSGTVRLYVDGVQEASGSAVSVDATTWLRIAGYVLGGWANAVTGYFPGDISVLAKYNRVLSAAEVLQNHNALRGRYGV